MKKIYVFTALLAVTLVAGVCIFYACKKEETIKSTTTPKAWEEKIEYMEITCVDFSRIQKKENLAKGEPMLEFESWEHYTSVIDALLEFCYQYTDTYVNEVLQEYGDINNNTLNEILQERGFYQFMPLYSFCRQLQFNNSAFEKLRNEEIEWLRNPGTSNENPFDEVELGIVQSALHNTGGRAGIGGIVIGPGPGPIVDPCRINENTNNKINNIWPTYFYEGKTREFRAKLHSNETRTYAKTSVYYYNKLGSLIIWCCDITVSVSGERYNKCDPNAFTICTFNKSGAIFASVVEKYCWYDKPNYLYYYPTTHTIFSGHSAPGKQHYLAL